MARQLLITFDYEVFLGNRSGYPEDCMLEPTRELMDIMAPHNIRAVFFVDTTYLLRLKEWAGKSDRCRQDFEKITTQLVELVAAGHYVFPHVHPHWLDAQYLEKSNQWQLNDISKYRFHSIDHSQRDAVFTGSVQLLRELLGTKFPGYQVDSFRAGGCCIQPFSDFKPYFEKNGIRFDFTVLSGIYQFTNVQYFDFSNAPNKPYYRFSEDVCTEDPKGHFVEFNISSMEYSASTRFLHRLVTKYLYKVKGDHTFYKGEGQPSRIVPGQVPKSDLGHDIHNSRWESLSIELMTRSKLQSYLDFMEKNRYMHFISHPKMVTKHNLKTFSSFLESAFSMYDIETDFRKMYV
jgi:hypothetical protein